MIRFLALILTLAAGLPPAFAATAELHATSGGHYVTEAQINGRSIRVLVDTGATQVALSHEDAQAAGLRPGSLDFDAPVLTANGQVKAARVRVSRIVIGAIRVDDVEAVVLPQGALHGTLLGMSFLSRLDSFKVEDGVLVLRK